MYVCLSPSDARSGPFSIVVDSAAFVRLVTILLIICDKFDDKSNDAENSEGIIGELQSAVGRVNDGGVMRWEGEKK